MARADQPARNAPGGPGSQGLERVPDEERARTHGFLLPRPRVERILGEAAQSRLLLVVAPPGYGKTTAVRHALAGKPLLWHTLEPVETHPERVAARILDQIRALTDAEPAPGAPPRSIDVAAALCAASARAALSAIWLVLDGWDANEGRAELTTFVHDLLTRGPRELHVVIVGRVQPPFKVAAVMRRGGVRSVSPDDLLFTKEEVRAFLASHWGSEASLRLFEHVHQISRGWPAGLALTALAGTAAPPTEGKAALSIDPDTAEVERLLAALPVHERHALLVCALLPEFTPSLVADLCGEPTTAESVEGLLARVACVARTANALSLAPSLHALLARCAARQLAHEERERIFRAAAHHFSRCGQHAIAVNMFLKSGDTAAAARTLDEMGVWGILQEDTSRHMIWAQALRDTEGGPGMHFVCARGAQLRGDTRSAASHYRLALEKGRPGLAVADRLQILPELAGVLAKLNDPAEAQVEVELASLVPEDPRSAALHRLLVAKNHRAHGRLAEAEALLEPAVSDLRNLESGRFLGHWLNVLGEVQLLRGRYDHALGTLRVVVDHVGAVDTRDRMNNLQMLGRMHGLCGDFEAATGRLGSAFRVADEGGLDFDGFIIALDLLLVSVWAGRLDEAMRWLERAASKATGFRAYETIQQTIEHFTARVWWAMGRRDDASAEFLRLLKQRPSLYEAPTHYCWPALDAAFALLRAGARREADTLLRTIEARVRPLGADHQLCNALILKAACGMEPARSLAEAKRILARRGFAFMPASDDTLLADLAIREVTAPASRPHALPTAASSVEIKTLGRFAILVDGGEVDERIWYRCGRARQLFQLLLSQETLTASGDEIVDLLWPDADAVRGRERLHTTVSDLRRVMRRAGLGGVIAVENRRGYYRVETSDARIDWIDFRGLVHRGLEAAQRGDRRAAEQALREAASLYAGPFLPEARYQRYAEFTSERLHQEQLECLMMLAQLHRATPEDALVWLRKAASHDPYEEHVHRMYVEACQAAGRGAEARKALEGFTHRFAVELGLPLPDWATPADSPLVIGAA